MRFLDANVILRYLTRDDEAKAEACYELFQQVQRGEAELATCEAIVAEVIYVLSSPRLTYRLSHEETRARLLPLLTLRGLRLPQKRVCLQALDTYASSPSMDFEDALATAHMEQRGIAEIVSYDRDFDSVPRVRRVEP
ncbi:MAG: type II toxin-antitoxin system VapC family toxin [Acidobacteria bacterium]|nr:type II toxin-antitoxin system VapC family toxin [Acidobacteriota bacterium]MXZ70182.1 type II toxin-antitoxin system VapC family toxin [Acidobacteriota bacterium]MYD71494.1 type II toxin-antitoxin system VapC family toxin [Acidobacteriota bacterium]MYJ06060.1 type II toxin-antitoxin system VapC family toxin [Acidobacteriota bacterium]